ncbi:hypothetical protein V2J09_008060 [Rumex salicifolius]
MAIESSNRSPSPMSSRQSPNPNFSDSKSQADKRGEGGVRRSGNGSPFPKPSVVAHPSAWCFTPKTTTANSPAEIGRRNSFSNINEHKENKKPNPSLKPIKGTKNFMSPTISAVSKVNPSPRKKALAERNEAVRTSASLSDGKFLFFAGAGDDDLKSETENCEFQEETHVSTCGAKKRVTFDDDVVVLSPEMIEPIDFAQKEQKEPSLDISKTTSFVSLASPIAPLDADPFVQPYDPKTNFLSPRPQFLRYKPPEEVSLNLNNHLLKNFEDTLSSETCSDNDIESSVEEVQSEEAPTQEDEFMGSSSNSSPSAKLESSDESILNPREEEVSVESEQEISVESEEETSDESEFVSKPRSFRRWRIITWLLFGAVALFSSLIVGHSPPQSVLSKVYQYNYDISEYADFSGSLDRMKEWSTTYLPLMISSFGETDEFTPSEFFNSSALICDANDQFVEHKASGFPSEEVMFLTEKGNGVQEEIKMDSDSEETALLQPDQDVLYIEQIGQAEVDNSEEDHFVDESGQVEVDYSEEDQFIEESGLQSHPEIESHPNLEAIHEEAEAQSNTQFEEAELPKLDETELEIDVASEQTHFTEQTEKEDEVDLEEPTSYSTVVESGKAQGAVKVIVASLCLATAVSILAMLSKYKKAGVKSISTTEQAELLIRKEDSLYGNPHGSQMDATETCNPSEMSSYSYSFYDNKREEEARGSDSEAQSKEERKQQPKRNYKRESLASSSSEYSRGSVSYGSFTTYSVMPTKKGDEDVVTPVRRSSRIRKQLISP